jgi:hypothetical protein
MIDRVFQSFDYDAAIMGFGGDADQIQMNVWPSAVRRTYGTWAKPSQQTIGSVNSTNGCSNRWSRSTMQSENSYTIARNS